MERECWRLHSQAYDWYAVLEVQWWHMAVAQIIKYSIPFVCFIEEYFVAIILPRTEADKSFFVVVVVRNSRRLNRNKCKYWSKEHCSFITCAAFLLPSVSLRFCSMLPSQPNKRASTAKNRWTTKAKRAIWAAYRLDKHKHSSARPYNTTKTDLICRAHPIKTARSSRHNNIYLGKEVCSLGLYTSIQSSYQRGVKDICSSQKTQHKKKLLVLRNALLRCPPFRKWAQNANVQVNPFDKLPSHHSEQTNQKNERNKAKKKKECDDIKDNCVIRLACFISPGNGDSNAPNFFFHPHQIVIVFDALQNCTSDDWNSIFIEYSHFADRAFCASKHSMLYFAIVRRWWRNRSRAQCPYPWRCTLRI